MTTIESPIKQVRERLRFTQTEFAAAAGVSKGNMSEMESGIAQLSEKMKVFLKDLLVDVKTVEEKHKAYMDSKRQQYREEAERRARAEAHNSETGG